MPNTVIAIKKSATPAAEPTVLANGELAINYADGKLFYKHANGTILPFNTQGGNAFGTINANGTLVVAGTSQDVVSLIAGNNITITGDAINDTIRIDATVSGGSTNSGGYYQGNRGEVSPSNYGDIFRIHSNTLTQNVTILSGNNAIAVGPINITGNNTTLTIQTGSRVVII
jgi:hypothetical protein